MSFGIPLSFEYAKAATPDNREILPEVLLSQPLSSRSHIVIHDFASQYNTNYRLTTPSILTAFIYVNQNQPFTFIGTAGSYLFVVVYGVGVIASNYGEIEVSTNDVVVLPICSEITFTAKSGLKIYMVCDEPLYRKLGASPTTATFAPTYFSHKEYILPEVEKYNQQEGSHLRNRNGIILVNEQCLDTKTITPTLWGLYNIIKPKAVQLPHRHNSVALDLCLQAPIAGAYTLMSKQIDSDGNLINPLRMDWVTGTAFTTPPGWWHSHHNDSDEIAIVFPVQDAGLHTSLRTLDIQFIKNK